MKEIKLTQGYVAKIDDEDYERVSKLKWCVSKGKKRMCAVHGITTGESDNKKTDLILMHRFIMNDPLGFEIDHINHDALDNRKENLRICARIENARNIKKHKKSNSGYKGVSYLPSGVKSKPYTSHIMIDGKLKHLGYFEHAEDAARAYDKKAKEVYGEFACLNFSDYEFKIHSLYF